MNNFIKENKNKYLQMDGRELLCSLPGESVDACVVDFQYRGIMDMLDYGNEGSRQKGRALLQQMSEETIISFLKEITFVLKPSAHAFIWIDKFILCEGSHKAWFEEINCGNPEKPLMNLVDMLTWNKGSIGMGYRLRKKSEYLLVYQKSPKTIKNWKDKGIPDVIEEKIVNPRTKGLHPHRKPVEIVKRLIESVTNVGDLVIDPCAGSFSTFDVCKSIGRDFIGCDLTLDFISESE